MSGKKRRLSRLFSGPVRRTIIVPVDDSLIFGPYEGLLDIRRKIQLIASAEPNAVLGFPGVFEYHSEELGKTGRILNLTASTFRSHHVKKRLICSIERALALDADCIALHLNVTSEFEVEMLSDMGNVIDDARRYDIPVLAIIYPRREREGADDNYLDVRSKDPEEYARLVCHCARIGKELGADIIKTHYTGSPKTFEKVVLAADPVGVVIAGGPVVAARAMLDIAYSAVTCGGVGISFGRNIFSRREPVAMLRALHAIVHENRTPSEAESLFHPTDDVDKW